MIRSGMLVVFVLLVAMGSAKAEEKKHPLQGAWQLKKLTSADSNPDQELNLVLHFNQDRAWLNDSEEKNRFKYKVDENSKPFLIDITTPDEKQIEGIWEIKGDELRLCVCSPQGVKFRPTEFHGRDNQILLILDRVKQTE